MEIIKELDENDCWLTTGAMIGHPYSGYGLNREPTDQHAGTLVGDLADTSPFRDSSGREYVSTGLFINNLRLLIHYLNHH
jgi:hypothetical protein